MKIYSDISSNPSQSISAAQNTYVLVKGSSDDIIRRVPLTVNGVAMGANGNITTAVTAVLTGPSSSGINNLINSSSGTVTGSITNATVWVVSGDGSTPSPNGLAYIFVSRSTDLTPPAGKWFPLSTLNQDQADLRYVELLSATTQNITSSLIISGSTTFSGSILWSGSSNANGATANVVVLSNGQLYVTGAYGAGGGGGPANPGSPFNSIQYNNAGAFAGSSSFTFNGIDTVNLTGSFIVSSSTNLIGTTNITGSLIVSSSSQIIGTETITGSLIVSSSSNVIGTSRVTGSLIVSNSFSTIGIGSITGSLSISSSVPGQTVLQITGTGSNTTAPIVQITGQTGGFVQMYDFNSGSLFSVNNNTGTAIIDVRSNGQTLIGSNTYQGMYDSTGYALMPAPGQTLTIPGYITSSYNALWFEYFVTTGSYSRTGIFNVIWSGSTSASIDTTSSYIGTIPTNNITFSASISSSYMQLIASASTNGWLIKGSIRGI
jgi:hypothetical protein